MGLDDVRNAMANGKVFDLVAFPGDGAVELHNSAAVVDAGVDLEKVGGMLLIQGLEEAFDLRC